mmetsp:Transcript_81231/g.217122  ORF Transcript_81231/g.217122 Transcript_81231/m.217122 type:complete len:215 (+) Transcript_81231:768-1412(+)
MWWNNSSSLSAKIPFSTSDSTRCSSEFVNNRITVEVLYSSKTDKWISMRWWMALAHSVSDSWITMFSSLLSTIPVCPKFFVVVHCASSCASRKVQIICSRVRAKRSQAGVLLGSGLAGFRRVIQASMWSKSRRPLSTLSNPTLTLVSKTSVASLPGSSWPLFTFSQYLARIALRNISRSTRMCASAFPGPAVLKSTVPVVPSGRITAWSALSIS